MALKHCYVQKYITRYDDVGQNQWKNDTRHSHERHVNAKANPSWGALRVARARLEHDLIRSQPASMLNNCTTVVF